MLCLKSFYQAYLFDPQELEIKDEIFDKYKYALAYIGVDFNREDVQEALLNSVEGFEDALRATIAYWYWLEAKSETLDNPSLCLIKALCNHWDSRHWQDWYLDNPNFRNPGEIFWEQAGKALGFDLRNQIIADINSDNNGIESVMFRNGKALSLAAAKRLGWERLKEIAVGERMR
ncbi:MAG: hypothetical protein SAL70_36615 [Scytonema sp. PMC 1070.18]|nr:hypothetical protein [Scytonema sp. PMC 1070.18]